MRIVDTTKSFRRDLKRIARNKSFNDEEFQKFIDMLASDAELDQRYRDHALKNPPKELRGARDIHYKPDIVILYVKTQNTLKLIRIGSHSELKLNEEIIVDF